MGMGREMIFSQAGLAALLVGGILFALLMAFAFYKWNKGDWFGKWPIVARIHEQRSNGIRQTRVEQARAWENQDGTWNYQFRPIPRFPLIPTMKRAIVETHAFPYKVINDNNTMDVLALGRGEYHPFKVEYSKKATVTYSSGKTEEVMLPELKPIVSEDFKFAHAHRIHKNYARKPQDGFLQQWGGVISVVVIGGVVFIILALVLREMQPISQAALQAATVLAEASKTCACGVVSGAAP